MQFLTRRVILLAPILIANLSCSIASQTAPRGGEKTEPNGSRFAELGSARQAIIEKDFTKAVRLLKEPAALGNADAQFILGRLIFDGMGVETDEVEGETWIREAAKQGHGDAMYSLGRIVIRKGEKLDIDKDAHAMQRWMDSCNHIESGFWISNAAMMGSPAAMLFKCLTKSDEMGGPSTWPEGYAWCKLAAEISNDADVEPIARKNLEDVTRRLSSYQRNVGEDRAFLLRRKMESHQFNLEALEKEIAACRDSKREQDKREQTHRKKTARRAKKGSLDRSLLRSIEWLKMASASYMANDHAAMIDALSRMRHPVRDTLIAFVAAGCIRDGRSDVGLQMAEMIGHDVTKNHVYLVAYKEFYFSDKTDEAQRMYRHLRNEGFHLGVIAVQIDRALVQEKHDEAMKLLDLVDDELTRSAMKLTMIEKFIERGDYENAKELIRTVEIDSSRSGAYLWLAAKYLEIGNVDEALKLRDFVDSFARPMLMGKIAGRIANDEGVDAALRIVQEDVHSLYKDDAVYEIMAALYSKGEYEQIHRLVASIEGADYRNAALNKLALFYAEHGDAERARKLIGSVEPKSREIQTLIELAAAYAKMGEFKHAKDLVAEIAANDLYEGIRAMTKISHGLAGRGEFGKAKRVLGQSIKRIGDLEKEFEILNAIYLVMDEFTEQTAQYENLLIVAETIPGDSARNGVLATILFHMGFGQVFPDMLKRGSRYIHYVYSFAATDN